jgi:hypothetical protein
MDDYLDAAVPRLADSVSGLNQQVPLATTREEEGRQR